MHPRYVRSEIVEIWGDRNKLRLWQNTELAVLEVLEEMEQVPRGIHHEIRGEWLATPIDIDWWKARDKEINHDLNAFLEERLRHLVKKFQQYVHKKITSYDTEEPAFASMLQRSVNIVIEEATELLAILRRLALKYRYTIMNGRTHGQEAELQSFGKRCLTWYQELKKALKQLEQAAENLRYSKISGAIGNYGSIDPELERRALEKLGFVPFAGSTQIMPRLLYAPLGQALVAITAVANQIALDIRLSARSGRPILQEPFGKKQKGSSAMPHKKNTIASEKTEGMLRMAKGYLSMITDNITTWEERAIEQSSVERVAWPDLFHVTIHALETMKKVLGGLKVYPDNMLREIRDSRGCYASSEVKEFLKEYLGIFGIDYEETYRIVQLAAFNAFEGTKEGWLVKPDEAIGSLGEADKLLNQAIDPDPEDDPLDPNLRVSLEDHIGKIIGSGQLRVSPELDADEEKVSLWNGILEKLFDERAVAEKFDELFYPSYLLRNEPHLFREILDETD